MDSEPRPSLLDRFLRLFSDVRPGESISVLLMLTNIFLILFCYYVIKTIREPLILESGGAEVKSYAAGGQALILMGFVPLYSWFATKVDRWKLILSVTLFFVINIELFALAVAARVPYVGIMFFIWVGFFSLTIIAQFWSYANDIYTRKAGERLFAIIAIGATAGSPLGSKIAGMLFKAGIKPPLMLQVSVVLLLMTLGIYFIINKREARHGESSKKEVGALAKGNGFALVFKSSYIRLIALLFILLNLVNTTGEYIISRLVLIEAEKAIAINPALDKGAFIGAFYGDYFFWVNIITVLIQALVVSRIVKYTGIAGVLLALPVVAFGVYGTVAAGVAFAAVRWAKTAENSSDYSIMNTGRQMLWLPLSREEKYKAKQAVDTFFVRLGDVFSALVVFAGTTWFAMGVREFAIGNLFVIVLWLVITYLIIKENRRLTTKGS